MPPLTSLPQSTPLIHLSQSDGVISLTNQNTTIAYCRYSPDGIIEYIFVAKEFRQQGYAKQLLKLVTKNTGHPPTLAPPISPLGHYLEAYCYPAKWAKE
jgi:GNAT superfamily N-acetyltransferase